MRIEFLVTGRFPGDGKPKPVAFPDPAESSIDINGIKVLDVRHLVELKLASGMTTSRYKDLGDVQELILALALPRNLSEQLDPYVATKYAELWDGIQAESDHSVTD